MLLTSIPIFVAALTFWVYTAVGNELTASTAFTALSLLNMLRGPLFMFPRVLSAVLDGWVGIERAQRLLNTKVWKRYFESFGTGVTFPSRHGIGFADGEQTATVVLLTV